MDRRDAGRLCGFGRVELHRPPLDQDLPAVGLVDAGQDLDQGRLAGAVLADQGGHAAGPKREFGPFQGCHARKQLADAAQFEKRGAVHASGPRRVRPARGAGHRRGHRTDGVGHGGRLSAGSRAGAVPAPKAVTAAGWPAATVRSVQKILAKASTLDLS